MKTSLFFFTFAAGFGLLNLIIRWNYIWDYNEWYCGRSCCVPISVSAAYWHSSKDTHTSAFDQIDIRNPDYVKAKHSKISGKNILLLTPFLLCCICVEVSPTPKTLTYKRSYLIFVIFLHGQNFGRIKFTPKKRVNYDKIHRKLQIFALLQHNTQ